MADSKKYDGSQWEHSLRKLTTATETIQSGDTIYANGQPITTYTLKGNEEHTGAPSPQNPVMPNGVGERTENKFDFDSWAESITGISGNGTWNISDTSISITSNIDPDAYTLPFSSASDLTYKIPVKPNTQYTMKAYIYPAGSRCIIFENGNMGSSDMHQLNGNSGAITFTTKSTTTYFTFRCGISANYPLGTTLTISNIMLNEGSALLPYEPYGYKIPISSGQQTIDIYIGDLPLLKSLDGTAVDEISNGTLTRRVDSDGSVLPTPTTTQITTPSIPTTEGANSITVDTTIQPSEFTATWTGWHNATVKEWDGSDWN